jgi:hypothetical protein
MNYIFGDIHEPDTEWLWYDWLEPYTKTDKQVKLLNDKFKKYNWQFKKGGFKHWGGDQCTGATLRHLIKTGV